jgi:hypothetical protein
MELIRNGAGNILIEVIKFKNVSMKKTCMEHSPCRSFCMIASFPQKVNTIWCNTPLKVMKQNITQNRIINPQPSHISELSCYMDLNLSE